MHSRRKHSGREAVPPGTDEAQLQVLDAEESRRLAALLEHEAPLTPDEQAVLQGLLDRYGQLLHERRIQESARRRGIAVEDVEREQAERLAAARRWWDAFDRDPDRDAIIAQAVADLRSRWPA